MNVGMRRHLTPSNSSPRENCAGITGSRCAPNANATLIPVAIVVLRPRRADEYDPVDGGAHSDTAPQCSPASAAETSSLRLIALLRSGVFISISVPFALGDWVSRAVLAWRLSNTLGADFCVEALEDALVRYGRPEIFNTDQGSQFTSDDFTGTLKRNEVMISMDGKGRCMDNIFVERLWRSLKYEEVYLNAYVSVAEAKAGIGAWLGFYNDERQHQSLGYCTPRKIYQEGLWICGRSASLTGSASPASRASSKGGEMLAFAHIPTGSTASKGFSIDEVNNRPAEPADALTAVGADIETGRAAP